MTDSTLAAWQVREDHFPADGPQRDQLRFLLRYAILAPSNHNSQPWLFRLRKDGIELFADRTRALPASDPEDRQLTISCGAALYLLRLAARHFGFRGQVVFFPEADDPDRLALFRPGPRGAASAAETELFQAILRRRTNRRRFEKRAVPEAVIEALTGAAAAENGWLLSIHSAKGRQLLAQSITEGDRIQGADPSFRREIAAWTHPFRRRSADGLPGFAFGVGDIDSLIEGSVLRTFEAAPGQGAPDANALTAGSPLLAVLGSGDDTPHSWLTTGQALAKILLTAETAGVAVSYLNQPIEIASLRAGLRRTLRLSGFPQAILRFGFGPAVEPTPRRPLDEIILP